MGITKKDLMNLLKDFPNSATVVVSSDPEGNSFRPLHDVSEQITLTDDLGDHEISIFSKADIDPEDRATDDFSEVIVLWP